MSDIHETKISTIKPNQFEINNLSLSSLIKSKFSPHEYCAFLKYQYKNDSVGEKLFICTTKMVLNNTNIIQLVKDDKGYLYFTITNNEHTKDLFDNLIIPFDNFNNKQINLNKTKKTFSYLGIKISGLKYIPLIETIYNLEHDQQFSLSLSQKHEKINFEPKFKNIVKIAFGMDIVNEKYNLTTSFFAVTSGKPEEIKINNENDLKTYLASGESFQFLIEISRFYISELNNTCSYNIKCLQMCIF